MKSFLRRYTELPFVIDFLITKELKLINPSFWDDRNDSYYIGQYANVKRFSFTYALCLTQTSETYHHWRVFSHGRSGVCIEFKKDIFLKDVKKIKGIRAEDVKYETIKKLQANPPETSELPFLKRSAFKDEKEFRLIYGQRANGGLIFSIPISFDSVNKIILSPWLPKETAKNIKKVLKNIADCSDIHIYQSTLVDNENWKKLAKNGA